jgi:hypothetical protein
MPKYVKTVVRKSNLVPWFTPDIFNENSQYLTNEEKQLYTEAVAEVNGGTVFPGYLDYSSVVIGNTKMETFVFDTLENLVSFINRTSKPEHAQYDPDLKITQFFKMVPAKLKELGLSDSYTASTSIETT